MQLLGALFMGNQVTVKPDPRGAACLEQFVRFLAHCGLPLSDVNLLHGTGAAMEELIAQDLFRMVLFTGSRRVAERLSVLTKGRIKIEDAGFDWKVLGPDVSEFEYVAYTADQDAYAFGGQKCSAQSMLFSHRNWREAGLYAKLGELAGRRTLGDLTIVPILTWDNERIRQHIEAVLRLPGAQILFGGQPLDPTHNIPSEYGAYYPTAVFVPIQQIKEHFELVTTELFGPFQIVTEWEHIDDVIELLEQLDQHLTAAVVSKDTEFLNYVLGRTCNGTTYAGVRARTTGAPQNHWFGPAADPRAGGIGTVEAIQQVWSAHREVILDLGPVPASWTLPSPS